MPLRSSQVVPFSPDRRWYAPDGPRSCATEQRRTRA